PYLYNATRNAPRHQRAEMLTELLDAAHDVTVEKAIDIAFNPQVYHAELWQERVKEGWSHGPLFKGKNTDAMELVRLIEQWNGRSDADSEGALAFYAFKKGLGDDLASKVDPPADVTEDRIFGALNKGADWLKQTFGKGVHVQYGHYFRV